MSTAISKATEAYLDNAASILGGMRSELKRYVRNGAGDARVLPAVVDTVTPSVVQGKTILDVPIGTYTAWSTTWAATRAALGYTFGDKHAFPLGDGFAAAKVRAVPTSGVWVIDTMPTVAQAVPRVNAFLDEVDTARGVIPTWKLVTMISVFGALGVAGYWTWRETNWIER